MRVFSLNVSVGDRVYYRELKLPISPFVGLKLNLLIRGQLWRFHVEGVELYEGDKSGRWAYGIVTLEVDKLEVAVHQSDLATLLRSDPQWLTA